MIDNLLLGLSVGGLVAVGVLVDTGVIVDTRGFTVATGVGPTVNIIH